MKCVKCERKEFMSSFCRKHFLENIEGRVKKEVRQKSLIKKNEKLDIKDGLSRHFINNVMNMPVQKSNKGRKVLMWTMDDEILRFLKEVFKGKKMKKDRVSGIRLFRTIKDKELETYAKLKGMKFGKKRSKDEKRILSEIDRLEKEHKETRFSIIRSI
ncbi:MAG: hypothetical protein KKE20_04300 [Nanoarchaeota archaeon]|nr:hypothetical protein [Nanoarchaeota archaeon]